MNFICDTDYIKTKSDTEAIKQGYTYDPARGQKIINFIESKFYLDNRLVRLQDWQKEFFSSVYSWIAPDGNMRWKFVSCWIAKKNGKSFLLSVLMILRLIMSDRDSMHYSCATSLSQSGIIFSEIRNLINNSKFLRNEFKIYDNPGRREIIYLKKNNRYVLLSSSKDSADGILSKTACIDEAHLVPSDYFTIIKNSVSGISQSLFITISTSGKQADESNKGYREYKRAEQIIDGSIIDLVTLPIIYAAKDSKDTDHLLKIETALEANPRARESQILYDDLVRIIAEAKEYPEYINSYKRYRLNIWCNNIQDTYIDVDNRWDKLELTADETIDLHGVPVWVGVDLSKGQRDLTGISLLYDLSEIKGVKSYIEKHLVFLPSDRIEFMSKNDKVDYQQWIDQGYAITCGSQVVEDEFVIDYIEQLVQEYNVQYVGFDPWNSKNIIQQLMNRGIDNVGEVCQWNKILSPAIKRYQEMILLEQVRHEPNACYRWQLTNAIAEEDKNGLQKITKSKNKSRIDNVDAIINAVVCWQYDQIKQGQGDGFYFGS